MRQHDRIANFLLTDSLKHNYNIIMDEILFEWDPLKSDLNYAKHKENDRIRIISARKANLKESKEYGGRI